MCMKMSRVKIYTENYTDVIIRKNNWEDRFGSRLKSNMVRLMVSTIKQNCADKQNSKKYLFLKQKSQQSKFEM